MSLNDPQWGKRGSNGPPDLDELWRNLNRRITSLFRRGGQILRSTAQFRRCPSAVLARLLRWSC